MEETTNARQGSTNDGGWNTGWISTVHISCTLNEHLIRFGIGGGLGVFRLLDVFHHFSYEGVAVVLILGHYNLEDKPQSPIQDSKFDIKRYKSWLTIIKTG